MREILFRGKRVDNGEWVEGSLVNNIFFRAESNRPVLYIIDPDEYESYDCMEDIGELAVEVMPETVSQYTGIKDKHGKKVFEGDVLRIRRLKYHEYHVVEFNNGMFFSGYNYGSSTIKRQKMIRSCDVEVVDNIHDNPELFGGK